jgi:hypothetical protein
MRLGQFIGVALVAFALTGCATDKPATTISFFNKMRPLKAIPGPEMVQIDIALLERPLHDRFLNNELWLLADEQIIPLERKAYLEEAGFRIGQVNGLNPSGLQTLLTSDRSCVIHRRQFTRAGNPALLPLGPAMARCRVEPAGSSEALEFEQADCLMQITPTAAPDNRLHLHCVPRIRHGETELVTRPVVDGSVYSLVPEKPIKDFDDLAFDVTLEINQYLVIGARSDRVGTLGWRCFWRGDEPVPAQRLLVLRTCRPGVVPNESADEPGDRDPRADRVPSVAQLASQPANQ